tara:strand:- start:136 stop:585 length:450 start_codon:yes stop_codon:yes gene_type:complete
MATAELIELGTMEIQLGEFIEFDGPKGKRAFVGLNEVILDTEKIKAKLLPSIASGEWATTSDNDSLDSLDVRITLETDDGEIIYIEYSGRGIRSEGLAVSAPTFQTGSKKYKWLNRVQAVMAGQVDMEAGKLVYRLYEVKIKPEEGFFN